MVDAKSRIEIELSLKDVASKELRRFGNGVERVSSRATRSFKKVTAGVNRTKTALFAMAGAVGVAFAAFRAIRTTLGAGFGFVKSSAEFEESLSKFSVVFGDFAADTAKDLDDLSDAVGRPISELVDFASTFQDTLVPMGLMREEAAGLSVDLVALAIDAASFGNKLDSDAVRDFQSALVGNTETVRKYGIVITEANTKQEAWTTGLTKQGEELSNVAKIQARLQLITKGLSDAIGDAERTSGSFQNQMKRLAGEIADLRVVFGELIKKEIQDAIRELGGLDKVIDLVKVGFGFVAGVTIRVIRLTKNLSIALSGLIESFGGANRIASALAGSLFNASVIMDILGDAARLAGSTIAAVFDGVLQTSRVFFKQLVAVFKQDFVAGMLTAFADALDGIAELVDGSMLQDAFGDLIPVEQLKKAAFLTRVQVSAMLNLMEMDALETSENVADIWVAVFEDIAIGAVDSISNLRSRLDAAAAEGLDFDFNLASLFDTKELSPAIQAAERAGNMVGAAFGQNFGLFAKIVILEGIERIFEDEAALAATNAAAKEAGEKTATTFTDGFKEGFTKFKETLTEVQLGTDFAAGLFGTLEGAISDFSRRIVDSGLTFKGFTEALLKDLAALIIRFQLLRAVGGIFGGSFGGGGIELGGNTPGPGGGFSSPFAEGGIMPGKMLSHSSLPIKSYAHGGIATSPQVGVFGEGGSPGGEAFVPLGGDRKIPVKFPDGAGPGGSGMQVTLNLTITSLDPRGAAEVFLEQFPLIEKKLASSIQAGTNRSLTTAIRTVSRGGR